MIYCNLSAILNRCRSQVPNVHSIILAAPTDLPVHSSASGKAKVKPELPDHLFLLAVRLLKIKGCGIVRVLVFLGSA